MSANDSYTNLTAKTSGLPFFSVSRNFTPSCKQNVQGKLAASCLSLLNTVQAQNKKILIKVNIHDYWERGKLLISWQNCLRS